MKNFFLVAFSLILLASCKKESSGCISQTTAILQLPALQNDSVLTILQKNNLPATNQVFYAYSSFHGLNNQNQETFYQYVSATQVKNGAPLFFEDLSYAFANGTLVNLTGKRYGNINLDGNSSEKLSNLQPLYIYETVTKQGFNASFKDSCLVAQFGYYDANLGVDTIPNFVKTWKVTPAHSLYPAAYFRDDNGALLVFVSGIEVYDLPYSVSPKHKP